VNDKANVVGEQQAEPVRMKRTEHEPALDALAAKEYRPAEHGHLTIRQLESFRASASRSQQPVTSWADLLHGRAGLGADEQSRAHVQRPHESIQPHRSTAKTLFLACGVVPAIELSACSSRRILGGVAWAVKCARLLL
jgi:hypothetical protein